MRKDLLEELGLDLIRKTIKEMHDNNFTMKDFYSLGEHRIYQAKHVFSNREITAEKIKELRLVRLKELYVIKWYYDAIEIKNAAIKKNHYQHTEIIRFRLYMLIWAWCMTVIIFFVLFNGSNVVMLLCAVAFQYLFNPMAKGGL